MTSRPMIFFFFTNFHEFSPQFGIPSFSEFFCFFSSIHRFFGCALGLFPVGFHSTAAFCLLRVWYSHHMSEPFDSSPFYNVGYPRDSRRLPNVFVSSSTPASQFTNIHNEPRAIGSILLSNDVGFRSTRFVNCFF